MNIKKIIGIASIMVASLGCMNVLTPEQSFARTMTVDWGMPTVTMEEDGASVAKTDDVIATRADALSTALSRAVIEETFALLPEDISPAQKSALSKYVANRAHTFVRGYHEESTTMLPSGEQRLVVDVNVDKQWLMDALKRLGAYYLAGHDALPCTLYYLGQKAADKNSTSYKKAANHVAFLATAAGLHSAKLTFMTTTEFVAMDRTAEVGQPVQVVMSPAFGASSNPDSLAKSDNAIAEALNAAKESVAGTAEVEVNNTNIQPLHTTQATPQKTQGLKSLRFILASYGKDAWSGKLQGPDYSAEASGSTIDMIWEKLWPAYLSTRFTHSESASDSANLQVWGWSSADGAVALDKAIRQWYQNQGYKNQGGTAKSLDLLEITMQGGVVKAVWSIDAARQSELKAFVRDYAEQRRLRYEVSAVQGLDSAE